uniref:Metalloendopeptidase n=1 Tax=Timema tahoe TaxID=61484 RepID=A0A7R9FKI1_9NEOP|nr:unnamed protein product [Timema tahoe]
MASSVTITYKFHIEDISIKFLVDELETKVSERVSYTYWFVGVRLSPQVYDIAFRTRVTASPCKTLPLSQCKTGGQRRNARYMLATLCLTFFLLPLNGRNLDEPISPGTDEGLYNPGLYQGDIVMKAGNKNAVTDPNLLWPNAAIIYKPDPDIGCPQSPQCKILMKAIDHYHEVSCVRFKEWTGENDVVDVFFNLDSGACWSPVGRSGDGEQKLSLGQRCWYLGIVIHELGHAVGFWHEMNRPDRDSYIYVYWDNIISVSDNPN